MKWRKPAVLALLLSTILTAYVPLRAADDDPKAKDAKSKDQNASKAANARGLRLKEISEQLKLSDEQKEKLKPMFQERAKKVRELRDNKELSREDRVAKVKELQSNFDGKLKEILTPEQLEKWNKLR